MTTQRNSDGTLVVLGQMIVQQTGLWPGYLFNLTATVQGYPSPSQFVVSAVTVTWQGVNPPVPVYNIQFGDTPLTLVNYVATH